MLILLCIKINIKVWLLNNQWSCLNWSFGSLLLKRHSRYVRLAILKGMYKKNIIAALIKHANKLHTELYKSLTWNSALEMYKY